MARAAAGDVENSRAADGGLPLPPLRRETWQVVRGDNDNNRTIWTGPFVLRRHWPLLLASLLIGIAISGGCSLLLKSMMSDPFPHLP